MERGYVVEKSPTAAIKQSRQQKSCTCYPPLVPMVWPLLLTGIAIPVVNCTVTHSSHHRSLSPGRLFHKHSWVKRKKKERVWNKQVRTIERWRVQLCCCGPTQTLVVDNCSGPVSTDKFAVVRGGGKVTWPHEPRSWTPRSSAFSLVLPNMWNRPLSSPSCTDSIHQIIFFLTI